MSIHPAPLERPSEDLRSGDRRVDNYVSGLCDRVAAVDPDVRALVTECDRRKRLLSDAESLGQRFPDPSDRPPLFGIPIGIKDIIHVDGFTTRAGSAVPPELFAGSEATIVSLLRDAGGLVLGKTVSTEFAGGAPGLTRNPHDLDHTPGGSSSGSAAAVAAGMCPLAVGTQTGGSVVRPAAYCGIVGFKPSYDRIPTAGVIPRSKSLDTVGLFTQRVSGMELAASVVCREWNERDVADQPILGIPEPQSGESRGPYLENASAEALAAFDEQVDRLEEAGYEIRRVPVLEEFERIDRWFYKVQPAEIALVHNEWFDEYAPFYRTQTADKIRNGRKKTAEDLAIGRAGRTEVREETVETMERRGIDIWICPTAPGTAPRGIVTTGDSVMNRPWTYAGLPAVTLPAGSIGGLPVGLQCVARFDADEQLLTWAEALVEAVHPTEGRE